MLLPHKRNDNVYVFHDVKEQHVTWNSKPLSICQYAISISKKYCLYESAKLDLYRNASCMLHYGLAFYLFIPYNIPCLIKKLHKLFMSELDQISINFNSFW